MSDWQCPLCECCEADWLFDGTDAVRATRRTFAVLRCRQCGLFCLQPRPQQHEVLSLYPRDYEPFWVPLKEESNWLLRWMRRRHWAIRCRAVRRVRPEGGRLLDVGCGTGHFLRELCRDDRWHGVGVDINEDVLDVARRQGVSVLRGELNDLHLPTASFDIVTIWEVIEHLFDPVGTLSEIHRILKSEGVMLLSTPNGKGLQARLWQRHWVGWDVPRHLQVFSPQALQQLLEETGFEVVRSLHFPKDRFHAVESVCLWLQVHKWGSVRAVARCLVSLVGLAAWPIFRIIDHTSLASSIILEARAVSQWSQCSNGDLADF